MATAGAHDGDSLRRPPAATLPDSEDGEFSYSLHTWNELLQRWTRWLPAIQREERELEDEEDSIFALPAWTGSWVPTTPTTKADATGSDLQDHSIRSPATDSGSSSSSSSAPPAAHALESMGASVTAPASTTTASMEAFGTTLVSKSKPTPPNAAFDTASAYKSKSPPPDARALLSKSMSAPFKCMEASDTAFAFVTPDADAHALVYMDSQDLLEDARRFAASLQDSGASLAAPAEELARALSIFVDKVGKKTADVSDASDLRKAVSALLAAANSPKASEEAAGEGRALAKRVLQLIQVVAKERHGRDPSCCAKGDEEWDGCDRRSCTSSLLPRCCCCSGAECCWSRARRGVDHKQGPLKDKWSTFFTLSMPTALSILPLLPNHIPKSFHTLFGYSYGGLFLLATAGLLLAVNAMTDRDLEIARIIGNLSVFSLAVLVSVCVWTLLDPGNLVMISSFLVAIGLGHGYAWLKGCFCGNRDPGDTTERLED